MRCNFDLSPSEVSQAIKEYLLKEVGKEFNEIILRVEPVTEGYGTNEHTIYKFTGATAVSAE